jgi:hypothetical protein
VNFEDLLNWQVVRNKILISSKNSEKNWLVALNSDAVTSAVGQIIEFTSTTFSQRKVLVILGRFQESN